MSTAVGSLSLSEIFRKSLKMFGANFLFFAGVAFFPSLAELASSMASVHPDKYADPTFAHSILVFLSYALSFFLWVATVILQALGTGAICFAVTSLLRGEEVTVASAFGTVIPRAFRLVWVSLIQTIFCCWPLIVVFPVLAIWNVTDDLSAWRDWIFWGVMIVFGIVPVIVLFLRYAIADPACMIEDLSASWSIERSVVLGRGRRWSVFWCLAISMAPFAALIAVCEWKVKQLTAGVVFLTRHPVAAHAAEGLPGFAISLASIPIAYIVLTLLYLQLLEQKEGMNWQDVLNKAKAARFVRSEDEEEPGPWDDATDAPLDAGEDSVGIPWSIFGAKDLDLSLQNETGILVDEPFAASAESDSSHSNKDGEEQA